MKRHHNKQKKKKKKEKRRKKLSYPHEDGPLMTVDLDPDPPALPEHRKHRPQRALIPRLPDNAHARALSERRGSGNG
eukprot:1431502-Rhodomonas_salina.1